MIFITFQFLLQMSLENPWNVSDLDEFLVYSCPECQVIEKNKDRFFEHAVLTHTNARTLMIKSEEAVITLPKLSDATIEKYTKIEDVDIKEELDEGEPDIAYKEQNNLSQVFVCEEKPIKEEPPEEILSDLSDCKVIKKEPEEPVNPKKRKIEEVPTTEVFHNETSIVSKVYVSQRIGSFSFLEINNRANRLFPNWTSDTMNHDKRQTLIKQLLTNHEGSNRSDLAQYVSAQSDQSLQETLKYINNCKIVDTELPIRSLSYEAYRDLSYQKWVLIINPPATLEVTKTPQERKVTDILEKVRAPSFSYLQIFQAMVSVQGTINDMSYRKRLIQELFATKDLIKVDVDYVSKRSDCSFKQALHEIATRYKGYLAKPMKVSEAQGLFCEKEEEYLKNNRWSI